jgi:hypothetical protein
MKRTKTFTVAATNVPCWIVALNTITGASREEIECLARKNGWDGISFGTTIAVAMMTLWDLTGRQPSAKGTKEVIDAGLTARQFSDPSFTGLIFVNGHVMPAVNGRVSNFCGFGDYPIEVIAQ